MGDALPLPPALADVYGPLVLGAHSLYANFVSSLDGVVAFEPAVREGAGSLLSGHNPHDRFLMALLRACADAVLIGAGTLRAEPKHRWTPAGVDSERGELYAELRRRLGIAREPPLFVVSRSGLRGADAVVLKEGAEVITGDLEPSELIAGLRARGFKRILTEGGPTLMGALLKAHLVDDLFLTLSPVLAGRLGAERPGFVAGAALLPEQRQTARLASLRRADDFLFARYSLS